MFKGDQVNLDALPLLRPWPGDAGGVVTLGLVITKDPETGVPNVGVYRLQRQSMNTMTVHWLSVRGGARHLRKAMALGKPLEVAVAIGVHPLLVMAAATPIPVQLSEWLFAGIYAGEGVRLAKCKTLNLEVPSHSEVVLEGTIAPGEVLPDGPFGDHMGFYGGLEDSPWCASIASPSDAIRSFSPPSAAVLPKRKRCWRSHSTGCTRRFFASRCRRSSISSCRWKASVTNWR